MERGELLSESINIWLKWQRYMQRASDESSHEMVAHSILVKKESNEKCLP